MPLEPYKRGKTWWARGSIEDNGRAITGYIRESTGSSTEAGARDWIAEREAKERRILHVGERSDAKDPTFSDLVLFYQPNREMAKALIPLLDELGHIKVTNITPAMVRNLGPKLYPENCTDYWRRWVITPVRAVINHAHDIGEYAHPIKIKGYDEKTRIEQDKTRGKKSRQPKKPGDWHWLLRFMQHANEKNRALALLMFTTGARIGQSVAMVPDDVDLANSRVRIPAAKGTDARWVQIMPELASLLESLKPSWPRGWKRTPENLRVFGYADRLAPRKNWQRACKLAGIEHLPPHAAGRHGFGQEMRVRRSVDKKAVEAVGGWSPVGDMVDKTYTHAENADAKILAAHRTSLVQAETGSGVNLSDFIDKSSR